MEESILTKYRPDNLDQVFGQEDAIKAIKSALDGETTHHAYLLHGAPGIGKTTLARIIANLLNAEVDEIDATGYSADDVREKFQNSLYLPFTSDKKRKVLIVDEVQGLSKQALQATLKTVEEPPSHLYFVFCTTDLNKIPVALQSRCVNISLKSLKMSDLIDFVKTISDIEKYGLPEEVIKTIASLSEGSPRRALSIIVTAKNAKTGKEVSSLVSLQSKDSTLYQLFEAVTSRQDWTIIQKISSNLTDDDVNAFYYYFAGALSNRIRSEKNKESAAFYHFFLEALVSIPIDLASKAKLSVFLGRACF